MKIKNSLNTAYSVNNRMQKRPNQAVLDTSWHPKIATLLAKDYHFLRNSFSEQDYLFRGMPAQFSESMNTGVFGYFFDDRPQCLLEQELDIFFLSHELSDALSISKLWEQSADSAILVLPSSYFTVALRQHESAMMGFAEPGFVFNYPLLVNPISIAELAYIIVHPSNISNCSHSLIDANLKEKLIPPVINQETCNPRKDMEKAIITLMHKHNISPAKIVNSENFPKKNSSFKQVSDI